MVEVFSRFCYVLPMGSYQKSEVRSQKAEVRNLIAATTIGVGGLGLSAKYAAFGKRTAKTQRAQSSPRWLGQVQGLGCTLARLHTVAQRSLGTFIALFVVGGWFLR